MTFVVTSKCNHCKYTDCVEPCPVQAFHEDDTMLYINPEVCIDCGLCVDACPVEAIYSDVDLPEAEKKWLEVNAEKSEALPVITETKEPLAGQDPGGGSAVDQKPPIKSLD